MKILYFGNNRVGLEILQFLNNQGEDIVGIVQHPAGKQKFGTELREASGLDASCIFDGSLLNTSEVYNAIKILKPDLGLSVSFGYILGKNILEMFRLGCINLHPSLLPFNRGGYPNVWSIIEETPAGITLHYIDEGVDTGDIIAQREVEIEPVDTGETLYHKLEQTSLDLFIETWPAIKKGGLKRIPQNIAQGTCHKDKDIEHIDCINLEKDYKAKDLINILRARAFSPYKGAYFIHKGKKVYMQIHLEYDDEA